MDSNTKDLKAAEQYALPLEFDAASAKIRGLHSNRIPKQQKIKNIGVLDKAAPGEEKTKLKSFDSSQYYQSEFGKSEGSAFASVTEMLVKIERFLGAPFLNGEAFAREVQEKLEKHQFVPNPILLRAKERGSFLAPTDWYLAPKMREADSIAVLQEIIQHRNFPNLNVCFDEVNEVDPLQWMEQTGRALDRYCAFQEKPYPALHAVCALDHPAMGEFLKRKSPSQKSRWRRSAGVLFTRGFKEQFDVYKANIGEIWESLIGNTDLNTLYFRPDPRMDSKLRMHDAVWAHLNLGAFVDPLTQKFRWTELKSTARILHQLLLLWQESAQPQVEIRNRFRVGLCGWGTALLKLGLNFESDTSFLLAKRIAVKLEALSEQNAASIQSSFGVTQEIPRILFEPMADSVASNMLDVSEGVGPISVKGNAFASLAMQAAMHAEGDLSKIIAVVPRLRRRTREEFEKLCTTAAALGFLGIRFYR